MIRCDNTVISEYALASPRHYSPGLEILNNA